MSDETELSQQVTELKLQVEALTAERDKLQRNLDFQIENIAQWYKLFKRASERSLFWHGKYAIVKGENNALRRKIDGYRQLHSTPRAMTDDALKAIEFRLTSATYGPWNRSTHGFQVLTGDSEISICELRSRNENHLNDAEFIAHAPADISDLLREVRRLRRTLGEQQPCNS